MKTPATALAIDPGNAKCGLAVVERDGKKVRLLHGEIVSTETLRQRLEALAQDFEFDQVILGNGTTFRAVHEIVLEALPGKAIIVVDERDTSILARERYWEYHPRRGWRRLLPSSLQVPPEPVDHYVALILAERALLPD
ncbi:MAG: putative pre-16S rRNA nuclease [Fimbriimonadales bacterium]|nr:MAG: putative pre-16S rRNA nuclease [Fimbriimonadales bacterium]